MTTQVPADFFQGINPSALSRYDPKQQKQIETNLKRERIDPIFGWRSRYNRTMLDSAFKPAIITGAYPPVTMIYPLPVEITRTPTPVQEKVQEAVKAIVEPPPSPIQQLSSEHLLNGGRSLEIEENAPAEEPKSFWKTLLAAFFLVLLAIIVAILVV